MLADFKSGLVQRTFEACWIGQQEENHGCCCMVNKCYMLMVLSLFEIWTVSWISKS